MLRVFLRLWTRNVAKKVDNPPDLNCCVVWLRPLLRYSYGLAFWFKCNFILWENILTKGNSCLGVMTLCPHGKVRGILRLAGLGLHFSSNKLSEERIVMCKFRVYNQKLKSDRLKVSLWYFCKRNCSVSMFFHENNKCVMNLKKCYCLCLNISI